MAQDQAPDQETVLYSVIALASLFYNTVESFGNIHSSQNDEKDEKILLTQLGVEQARLMIWGNIVGIFSPPVSLAAHAPKPGPTDKAALYSRPRDARLDQDPVRSEVEHILTHISHSSTHPNREEMANANGLKSWQKGIAHTLDQPAVDAERVVGLEKKYSEILDVASAKGGLEKPHRDPVTQWVIFDTIRFSNFVKYTKQQVDKLVSVLGDQAEVERTLKADIAALGEHPEGQPTRNSSKDMAKLKFIIKACKGRYPAFVDEAQAAFQRIQTETGATQGQSKLQWLTMPKLPEIVKSAPSSPTSKRPGLISRLSTQTAQTLKRSGRKTPTASQPGTPAASRPGTPTASRPGSPVNKTPGSFRPNSAGRL